MQTKISIDNLNKPTHPTFRKLGKLLVTLSTTGAGLSVYLDHKFVGLCIFLSGIIGTTILEMTTNEQESQLCN